MGALQKRLGLKGKKLPRYVKVTSSLGQDSWSELEDVLTAIRLAGLWEPHEIKYSGLVVAGLKTQEPSRLFVSIAIR